MIQSLKQKINVLCIAVSTVLLVCACSAVPADQVKHYRLPHLNQSSNGYCDAQSRRVRIDAGIGQDGVMVQKSDLLMVEAKNNRWLGGLDSQLQNSLQRRLTEQCGQTLQLSLMQFYGNNQGEAVVAGYWHYRAESNDVLSGHFEQRIPLSSDGYDGLVRALDRAWLASLDEIEQAINNQ
ncbi:MULTISPECIES: PqiC family protein [Idiomarina]|jgi:uncharacterized lipoprotein YmbA|uniref:ABC-type transport auxiliary lipoprotein component domain-containing protein n=1 Tax=Idiomarina baltica OS145 TaxID=314276 RepID=A0ABP2CN41_9GAMM|nr:MULTISPECIES: ABC-type transport auxiliary lipoprotein family protein [Idiomarina]EAQ31069.1 hypothetical protein OS145_11921 [Idiomarina baltica OS145]KXS35887.1 MAG: Uncharacterized protein AWU56_484 [Idiomarina sp. T82-3]MEC8924950.1 ABC-type transport auxiliary lipoprotein family protein [Pseudomonadota bacterium]|tara:strand:- start:1374 stop:1913 length:540 start_codon:yes stop_codon:yes gene_type:complete